MTAGLLADKADLIREDKVKAADVDQSNDDEVAFSDIFWEEACRQLKIGIPMTLSGICKNLQAMSSAVILGRKDVMLLASISLQGAALIFLDAMVMGGSLQIEALCAMAMGAGNFHLVGIYLQMGIVFCTVLFVPFGLLRVFTGSALQFLGVHQELASKAGLLSLLLAPSLITEMWYMLLRVYYAAQGIVTGDFVMSWVFIFVTSLCLLVGVRWLDMGIPGFALAMTVKRVLHLLGFGYYNWVKGYHKKTWNGFDAKALMVGKRWRVFLTMAIPGMIGGCVETANWGLNAVFAARLGHRSSAAYDLAQNVWVIGLGVCYGLSNGTSILMSRNLGAGHPNRAKASLQVGIVVMGSVAAALAIIYYFAFGAFVRLATTDKEVISLVVDSYFVPVVSLGSFPAIMCTFLGDSLAKQGRVAAVVTASPIIAWFIGLPVAFFCTPVMGITGIFLGLIVGDVLRCIVFGTLIWTSDWKKISEESRERAEMGTKSDPMVGLKE